MSDVCRKGLVALGDSITVGEGSMQLGVTPLSWAQWLARAVDLPYTSYAENGATATTVLQLQLPRVTAHYDLAVLYVGVNDARSPAWDAAAYERDLDAICTGLGERAAQLLVLTLPADLGRPTCAPKPREANAIVRRVAADRRATVVDLEDFGGWVRVLPDTVHPTAIGQLEIADRAVAALGVDARPSVAVRGADPPVDLRYAPAHGRALVRDLLRRARERAEERWRS